MALKYYVCGDKIPRLDSPKIKRMCEHIEGFVAKNDEETIKEIRELCGAIVDMNEITRDKLKATTLVADIKAKALACRQAPSKEGMA